MAGPYPPPPSSYPPPPPPVVAVVDPRAAFALPPRSLQPLRVVPRVQQTVPIHNNVNLKKASVTLRSDPLNSSLLFLDFVVDAAQDFVVVVHVAVSERRLPDGPHFHPRRGRSPLLSAAFEKGTGVKFAHPHGAPLIVAEYGEDVLFASCSRCDIWPIVIEVRIADSASRVRCQCSYLTLTRSGAPPGEIGIRALRQSIQVDDKMFNLQEIYGIDRRISDTSSGSECSSAGEVSSSSCVICLSSRRDTTVLPCRHMCLCSECARELRFQTDRCPMCRCAIESLMQITVRDETSAVSGRSASDPASSCGCP